MWAAIIPAFLLHLGVHCLEETYCLYKNGTQVLINGSTSVPVSLIIANGGGGQAGMVGHLAFSYLHFRKNNSYHNQNGSDICIGWHQSNTFGSHRALVNGAADIAIVYDLNRVEMAIEANEATERLIHVWMDRFSLIGPKSNPGNITASQTFQSAILSIMKSPKSFFLTRVDNSTTHYKEAFIVAQVVRQLRKKYRLSDLNQSQTLNLLQFEGVLSQLPEIERESIFQSKEFDFIDVEQARFISQDDKLHSNYSLFRLECRFGFYRPLRLMPIQTARELNRLHYYSLSDYGIWNSLYPSEKSNLKIFIDGSLNNQESFFLNPAYALLTAKITNRILFATEFMDWLESSKNLNKVVSEYTGRLGLGTQLYEIPRYSYQMHDGESINYFFETIPRIYDGA